VGIPAPMQHRRRPMTLVDFADASATMAGDEPSFSSATATQRPADPCRVPQGLPLGLIELKNRAVERHHLERYGQLQTYKVRFLRCFSNTPHGGERCG